MKLTIGFALLKKASKTVVKPTFVVLLGAFWCLSWSFSAAQGPSCEQIVLSMLQIDSSSCAKMLVKLDKTDIRIFLQLYGCKIHFSC